MKIDWYVFIICFGMIILLTIPIGIYFPSPEDSVMSFVIGLIMGCVFLKWGIKNEYNKHQSKNL